MNQSIELADNAVDGRLGRRRRLTHQSEVCEPAVVLEHFAQ